MNIKASKPYSYIGYIMDGYIWSLFIRVCNRYNLILKCKNVLEFVNDRNDFRQNFELEFFSFFN